MFTRALVRVRCYDLLGAFRLHVLICNQRVGSSSLSGGTNKISNLRSEDARQTGEFSLLGNAGGTLNLESLPREVASFMFAKAPA